MIMYSANKGFEAMIPKSKPEDDFNYKVSFTIFKRKFTFCVKVHADKE